MSFIGLKSPSCKLRAVCEIHQDGRRMAELDIVAEVVRMVVENMQKEKGEELGRRWMKAAEEGRRGAECGKIYKECEDFERKLLEKVNSLSELSR